MNHPCPDCGYPGRPLVAAAAPPNAALRLCSVCGYPIEYLGWRQWSLMGYVLDIRDEFYLMGGLEGSDYAA